MNTSPGTLVARRLIPDRRHPTELRRHVLIEKRKIVDILRSRGEDQRADWVDRDLPEEFDTNRHSGLLSTLRIDLAALTGTASEPTPGN